MASFASGVRSGEWKGHTGRPIRAVVNIGIGGSDLGPVMAYEALRRYSDRALRFRFVSNVDATDFVEAVRDLDPGETLFIVASKTFTTLETMTNARAARDWLLAGSGGDAKAVARHFVACRPTRRRWPNSGSTPRTCSASGTGSAAAIRWTRRSARRRCSRSGRTIFARCSAASTPWTSISGRAPFERNLPVLMGLLALWNNNFLGADTVAVLPYEQYLKRFPAYLQQLTMESNGKHVTQAASG
jgi:glucose-6-phosphate isomerase